LSSRSSCLLPLLCIVSGCSFTAPDPTRPLGCACDDPPHAFAYCAYDRCKFAGCQVGQFDLDHDQQNGCETEGTRLPGNLLFADWPGAVVVLTTDLDTHLADIVGGLATVTADPSCKTSLDQRCPIRLEALQLQLSTVYVGNVAYADGLVATTEGLAGADEGAGVSLDDVSAVSISFASAGRRVPMDPARAVGVVFRLSTLADPRGDTVTLQVETVLVGNVDGQRVMLQINNALGFARRPPAASDASTGG
jgi:hypothetical protein